MKNTIILLLSLAYFPSHASGVPPEALQMMGRMMCNQDDFTFRYCYSATLENCQADATEAAKKCVEKIPEPKDFASSGEWGLKIGHCSEQLYHTQHAKQFSKDEKCQSNYKTRLENYKSSGTLIK